MRVALDLAAFDIEQVVAGRGRTGTTAAMRDLPVVPICRGRFRLRRRANHWLKLARLAPDQEGRIAIVTDVGRGMRWTLWAA